LPEIMSGGVALLDYDGDDDLDLFFAQGAPFRGCEPQQRDFRDLLVCNLGGCRLLRNDVATAGVFADVTAAAGLASRGWCQCAAFADFDRDGDLDLYVGHYVAYDVDHPLWCGDQKKGAAWRSYCHPDEFRTEPHELYR